MTRHRKLRSTVLAIAAIAGLLAADRWAAMPFAAMSIVSSAEARVGRPRTPRSVAGVARRTTRRTVRRSAIYVSTLPSGCVVTSISGVRVWSCGGTYYQSYGGRYVVVYVD